MEKIAILGYGKEGQAVEAYFKDKAEITIFDNFSAADLPSFHLENFDQVFRSPSVPPILGFETTSSTKYFFAHCPARIIGVTGTKGKGTTCSMIAAILQESGQKVHLVGNIGNPAISVLDDIQPTDLVVYEMSSFQLWDLHQSPQIAVVLRVEPDHLDKHSDFADYVSAKTKITRFQTPDDICIYFKDNATSVAIADHSKGTKIPYPDPGYNDLVSHLRIPGEHNKENAAAALAVIDALNLLDNSSAIRALENFQPLPHHIEFVRTLNNIDYYDDSFSASYPSLDVALSAFQDRSVILIAGGKNRNLDLTTTKKRIFTAPNLKKAILIGETAGLLAAGEDPQKYEFAKTLQEAVEKSRQSASPDSSKIRSVVLLSPGAASFDMFKNFYDRGEQFQKIVKELK